ncbi:hypothetical protein Cyan10605_3222 [Cyanobacterium aponinum PCC 10605]|uniref:Uncharacterized protein n=1 Tax=Cyanobacterium aponinum (strain PCC 10605) TaxID=755178 RepID=K9Z7Z8_CYAAP|nr:hypothetical protein Cyan10605_3222 [Cyanobacterium aponinum PCC 10605]
MEKIPDLFFSNHKLLVIVKSRNFECADEEK